VQIVVARDSHFALTMAGEKDNGKQCNVDHGGDHGGQK
jgi:hypothetical protein